MSKNGFYNEALKSNIVNDRNNSISAKDTIISKGSICNLRSFKQLLGVERGYNSKKTRLVPKSR